MFNIKIYNIVSSANSMICPDINHSPSEMELTDVIDVIKKKQQSGDFLERKNKPKAKRFPLNSEVVFSSMYSPCSEL